MKTLSRQLVLAIIFASAGSALSACESDVLITDGEAAQETSALTQENRMLGVLQGIPSAEISAEESKGLIFLREEEKLARDVYRYFAGIYSIPAFRNIPKSEQQHMDAVGFLLSRYDLVDPAAGTPDGTFKDETLQELYNELIQRGSKDLKEALMVGALIEEKDIADLKAELEASVDNQDIAFVYGNLIRGSENHLRAFTGVLKTYGVTYSPVILDKDYYNSVISK